MCGITGYVGERPAAPFLVDSLFRLEYRGYDSAGIATLDSGLHIRKDKGQIAEIESNLKLSDLPGTIGIGHTRWATHGVPSQQNSHPHTDCKNEFAVVHNGIIENYSELKEELASKGHKFKSETDTEIIAHLIEESYSDDLEKAVITTVGKLDGSFALAILSSKEPDKIIAIRNKSPLVIGIGDGENFLASDIPAFLKETKKVIILENNEYAILTKNEVTVKDLATGEKRGKEPQEITWSAEAAEKGGFPYFAEKEIKEIPNAVEAVLATRDNIKKITENVRDIDKIVLIACGTSYHAALIGKYLLEKNCKIRAEAALASEFPYGLANVVDSKTLVIAISQSGETADTLQAVQIAREKGAKVFGVVNVVGSSLDREANFTAYSSAGPEIAVIATKTFVAQLTILYMFAFMLGGKSTEALQGLPELIRKTIESTEDQVKSVAEHIKDRESVYFIGRGLAYPLVLEGALKLKEISYIHAEGMPAGELKHGTLSLIADKVPVIVCLMPEAYDRTMGNIEEVKARDGYVVAVTNEKDEKAAKHVDVVIKVPEAEGQLYPLLQVIPLQLLAYYTTVSRGLDPDKPRNLAKCVTVE